jgi:hypothetical protein
MNDSLLPRHDTAIRINIIIIIIQEILFIGYRHYRPHVKGKRLQGDPRSNIPVCGLKPDGQDLNDYMKFQNRFFYNGKNQKKKKYLQNLDSQKKLISVFKRRTQSDILKHLIIQHVILYHHCHTYTDS